MSESKHTPGDWEIVGEGFDDFEIGVRVDDTGYYDIATVHDLDEESEPNARLIAAAPELLEALEEIYEGGAVEALHDPYVIQKAFAALAKAKGENHD